MFHRSHLRRDRGIRAHELRQCVALALAEIPDPELRRIRIHVSGSTVTLWGRVPNEQQKFAAENVVRGIPGVESVYNRLQVMQHPAEQFGPRIFTAS